MEPKQWIHPLSQKLNDVHLEDFEFKDKKANKQKKQQATIRRFFLQICEVAGLAIINKKT